MGWIYNASPQLAEQSRKDIVLIPTCILTLVMVIFVSLRLWLRKRMLAAEDYIIMFSAMCAIAYGITNIIQTRYGLGLVPSMIPYPNLTTFFKYNLAGRPLYAAALAGFKISLCLNYLRFSDRTSSKRYYRAFVWAVIAFVAATNTTYIFISIFACNPIKKSIDFRLPGSCIPYGPPNIFLSVTAIISDIACFVLPLNLIRPLSLPTRQKVQLWVLFGLGLVTIVFTILRATVIPEMSSGQRDPTRLLLYSTLEIDIGIIITCAPHLRKLIDSHRLGSGFTTSRGYNYGGRSHGTHEKSAHDIEAHGVNNGKRRSNVVIVREAANDATVFAEKP